MIKLLKGGTSGVAWDHKGKSQVAQIYISRSNSRFESIQFLYVENGNKLVLSDRIGPRSQDATFFDRVILDYKTEYITWISGRYQKYLSTFLCLTSITFGTNKNSYGPFSVKPRYCELDFNYQFGAGLFYGFCGTINFMEIESIGVYLKPPEADKQEG